MSETVRDGSERADETASLPHETSGQAPSDFRSHFVSTYASACRRGGLIPNAGVIAASAVLSNEVISTSASEGLGASNELLGDGPYYLLDNVTLGPHGCECLAAALTGIPLTTLAVSNAYANDEGAKFLINAATTSFMCTTLVTVSLRGNGLQSAAALGVLLTACPQLVNLDLAWNKFGLAPHEFATLCAATRVHRQLRALDISNCLLGGPAIGSALADCVAHNASLTTLDLSWNNLMSDSHAIVDALARSNNKITKLLLDGNGVSRLDVDVLVNKLHANERTAWELSRQSRTEATVAAALKDERAKNAKLLEQIEALQREAGIAEQHRTALEQRVAVLNETYSTHKAVVEERASTAEAARAAADARAAQIQRECDDRLAAMQRALDESSSVAECARQRREAAEQAALEERTKLKGEVAALSRDKSTLEDRVAVLEKTLAAARDDYEKQADALGASRKRGVELEAEVERLSHDLSRRKAELAALEMESDALRVRVRELGEDVAQLNEKLAAAGENAARSESAHAAALAELKEKAICERSAWEAEHAAKVRGLEAALKVAEGAIETMKREAADAREAHTAAAMRSADDKQRDALRIGELEAALREAETRAHTLALEKRAADHAAQLSRDRLEAASASAEKLVAAASAKHDLLERQLQQELEAIEARLESEARRALALEGDVQELRAQNRALKEAQRVVKAAVERRMLEKFRRAMRQSSGAESSGSERDFANQVDDEEADDAADNAPAQVQLPSPGSSKSATRTAQRQEPRVAAATMLSAEPKYAATVVTAAKVAPTPAAADPPATAVVHADPTPTAVAPATATSAKQTAAVKVPAVAVAPIVTTVTAASAGESSKFASFGSFSLQSNADTAPSAAAGAPNAIQAVAARSDGSSPGSSSLSSSLSSDSAKRQRRLPKFVKDDGLIPPMPVMQAQLLTGGSNATAERGASAGKRDEFDMSSRSGSEGSTATSDSF